MRLARSRRIVFGTLLAFAFSVVAIGEAGAVVVLCKKGNKPLRVRQGACKGSETQIPASELGVTGPQGGEGDTGDRGPSNGFASFTDGPVFLPFSTFTTIASLSLPAGSFLVLAKASITNDAGTGDTGARCRLVSPATQADEALAGLEDVNIAGSADAGVITMIVATTLATPGDMTLRCRNEGGGTTNARFIKLSAIQVGALSNVASP